MLRDAESTYIEQILYTCINEYLYLCNIYAIYIYIYMKVYIFKYSSHVFWCFKSQEVNLIAFNNLILTSLWAPCAMQLAWHYGYVRQELLWTWFCFVVFFSIPMPQDCRLGQDSVVFSALCQ